MLVLALYTLCLTILCFYGTYRVYLIYQLVSGAYQLPKPQYLENYPLVCVQIPLYNELQVAERIVKAVLEFTYPKELIEIQILDDSNDETVNIIDKLVIEAKKKGFKIEAIRREKRSGFKAGALQNGIDKTEAKFFAIFDSDFVPPKDFLIKNIPLFRPKTAFVQTRWSYLNRTKSFFTRAQAILLDGHFLVEHSARAARTFFNFNGTAGIWRKEAILDAGGWQADTLTEDLDLSYRAKLKGWNAIYNRDYICPSELPETISAFKTQQYRWMKGTAQVFKKQIKNITFSKSLTKTEKFDAFMHLSYPFCYVWGLILGLLIFPAGFLRFKHGIDVGFSIELCVFFLTIPTVYLFYVYSQVVQNKKINFLDLTLSLMLGIGMSPHCTKAIFSGFFKSVGEFIRTPKFGNFTSNRAFQFKKGVVHSFKEIALIIYLFFSYMYFCNENCYYSLPFVFLIIGGYFFIFAQSLRRN